tara:strand:- start:4850 stop:5146 length:297 start_codon:yes stop_codon:yes gene_type:complete
MKSSDYLQRNKSQSDIVTQVFEINRSLKTLRCEMNELKENLKKETLERKKQYKELASYISKLEQAYGNGLFESNSTVGMSEINSFNPISSTKSIFDKT